MVGFDAGGLSGAELAQHAHDIAQGDRQRKQDLEDKQQALDYNALEAQLKNAKSPDEVKEILYGEKGVFTQPGSEHHPIQFMKHLLGKLTGRAQQPMGTPPFVAPNRVPLVGQGPAPMAAQPATATPQAAPSGSMLGPGSYGQQPTPPTPLRPPGAPAGPTLGPAPGPPARPVPPGMRGKQPKPDPAIELAAKYWRSPTQIAEQQDKEKLALFHQRLDDLNITDPKERQRLDEEFLRSEFDMKAVTPGKSNIKNFRDDAGHRITLDTNAPDFQIPPGFHLETSGRVVFTPAASIGAADAKKMAAQGKQFKDQNGDPIDVSQLEDWEKLVPGSLGTDSFYMVADMRERAIGAGGDITEQHEFGKLQPAGVAPSLGARIPPTSTTHTETGPDGTQVLVTTTTTTRGAGRAPAAPVASGAVTPKGPAPGGPAARMVPPGTAPVASAAAPGAVPGKGPAPGPPARPTPPGAASPATDAEMERQARDPRGLGVVPNIDHMTQKNANATRKLLPMVTGLLGMFGDPRYPKVPSMADFADLANDDHAKKILGEAFKLLHREVGEVTDPGRIETLQNAAGWANYKADVEAQIQRTAGEKMTQREQDYFDAAIAGMADIIGIRGATGQSPAKFSVGAIQNELPLIGLSSTVNKREYLTKLLTVTRQLDTGLGGMSDKGRALWWLRKRRTDLENELDQTTLGGPARPVPPAPGGKSATIVVKPEDM